MQQAKQNLSVQKWVAAVSVVLLVAKLFAWFTTHSVAILTDALESIVNVAAGFIGLYSLYVAAKPRDKDHPYGHGKAEFLSAAVEGTLIAAAAILILYNAVNSLLNPGPIHRLNEGMIVVAATALVNGGMGLYCLRIGKRNSSLALEASGKHLLSDTVSTVGILLGLFLLYFTNWLWIDAVVAILFGLWILFTAWGILRRSIAGIMDEADEKLLQRMAEILERSRSANWVDLHNLRVIKYGSILHIDCHLTVPWYLNVHEAHREIDHLSDIIRYEFGESVEFFVHSDGCLSFQCQICDKQDCTVRKHNFERKIEWTLENMARNKKHGSPNE
ncbi:MAG: cation diffusion facilitator family transporter [Chitinophagaceae bacterium]|nr:cation diffusion facilitator family transporter [Chitinophagaceae bacterium]